MSDKPIDVAHMAISAWAMDDGETVEFDQPCAWGERVGGHAVYCTNDAWIDGPRKCRRTWYTGGEFRDEDCEGFKPNPDRKDP